MRRAAWKPLTLLFCSLIILSACGGDNDDNSNGRNLTESPEDFDDLRAWSSAGLYSDVLTDCVKAEEEGEFCNLATLPLLGQEVLDPSVDDIMNRVVISHDWMAENFQEILEELPADMLPLFRGLTAIVIDDDIRPAFYTTSTGAIYLDPAYLWMSVNEKRTINPKEDYRAGFDDELSSRPAGFYMDGRDYGYYFGSLDDNATRSVDNTKLALARLLLHELAHVNDFIPQDSYDLLEGTMTVTNAAVQLIDLRPSNVLANDYPLQSQMHLDLAEVMYFGESPTETQKQIAAAEAGAEFEPDGASDHYAYSNQYEDAAMLFETTMMKHFFGLDHDVFFYDVDNDAAGFCDQTIGWGQFNRVGDSNVKSRAQYIVSELLPTIELSLFFQDLPPPTAMTPDLSWCDNIDQKPLEGESNNLQKTRIPHAHDPNEIQPAFYL